MADRVLLTGISGFIGGHVALALLRAGHAVRGSVRSLGRAAALRDSLAAAGADPARLDFVALDLLDDAGWAEAAEGCRYVQHVASPFVVEEPRDRDELIGPAIAGTERAVRAALASGVERVVLTSSMAAIMYGHPRARTAPFTAADWTDVEAPGITAYVESKARAERRAWELMREAGREADLAVVNPSTVLGPLIDDDPGTSGDLVRRLLAGGLPAVPRIRLPVNHVADVAEAHLKAMTAPMAGGRRFPLSERAMSLMEIVAVLREAAPARARRLPRFEAPDWLIRLLALVDPTARAARDELGRDRAVDRADVEALLGRPLTPAPRAIRDTAESLLARGLV